MLLSLVFCFGLQTADEIAVTEELTEDLGDCHTKRELAVPFTAEWFETATLDQTNLCKISIKKQNISGRML